MKKHQLARHKTIRFAMMCVLAVFIFIISTATASGNGSAIGLVITTSDGGSTWTATGSELSSSLRSLAMADENTGWAVGVGGTIAKTTDSGSTWTVQNSGTTEQLTNVYFHDADTGWAAGASGTILYTGDGGTTWAAQASNTDETLEGISFIDTDTGWVVGADATLLKTTDGGDQWSTHIVATTDVLNDIHFVDIDTGWMVGHNGTILHTDDGGATWTMQISGTTEELESVYFTSANDGWIAGYTGTILHTSDGGSNWTPQVSGVEVDLRDLQMIDDDSGWVAGNAGTVLYTDNGGTTWTAQPSGVGTNLRAVSMSDANTGLMVGYVGTDPLDIYIPGYTEPGWGRAFLDAISKPYVIALFVLVVLGSIAFIKRSRAFRYLTLISSLAYLGFVVGGTPCAVGTVQFVFINITNAKLNLENYVIMGIPLVGALLMGRTFCGWVCPMGATQQLLHRKDMAVKVPSRVNIPLNYVKYVGLVVLLIAVIITQFPQFCEIDPFYYMFNLRWHIVGVPFLVAILLASIFMFAPFCRYLCPLGAFLSLFSKFSLFKLKILEGCTNCKACSKIYCDYQAIEQATEKPYIRDLECTRCGECRARCPKGTIELER